MRESQDDDARTFREAVRDVRPLAFTPRVAARRNVAPRATFRRLAEREILRESILLTPAELDVETGDELSFRRDGIQDALMRRLRRGHYRVESELDLHGLTLPEAKEQIRSFVARSIARQARCVRIIHGKGLGSGPRGPVLKHAVNVILRRFDAVLAFCSARQVDGGTGAIYVLLSD